jgi:hypothetical protein
MQQSIKQDLDTADQLFRDVASEASGVFLRVRLVVLSNPFGRVPENRSTSRLPAKVEELPPDLEGLYGSMLENIRESDREQASRLFQMVHCAPEPLGTVALALRTTDVQKPSTVNTENDDDGQSTDMVTKWKVA